MNASTWASAGQEPQRVTTRIYMEFMLKVFCSGARIHDGNLNRTLVYFAIQHANVAHFSKDVALAWAYAATFRPTKYGVP